MKNTDKIILNIPDYDGVGIYMIKNLITGKVYIGSSVNVKTRIKQHDYAFKKGTCNQKFLEDIEKGHKFTCVILEKYDMISRYELRDRESYFVNKYDSFNSGYNNFPVITYDPYSYKFNQYIVDWLMEEL